MYQLKIHKNALKFFKSQSSSKRILIKQKLDFLTLDPFLHPQLDIKKLQGTNETYRLRIGKIRIIYQVQNEKLLILVITAGTRGDIYKKKK